MIVFIAENAPGRISTQMEFFRFSSLTYVMSVSYTHLDVYKRQVPTGQQAGIAVLCAVSGCGTRLLL